MVFELTSFFFQAFYYVLPFGFYLRSFIYTIFVDADWEECTDPATSSVCVPSTDGSDVLDEMSVIFPIVESENRVVTDVLVILAVALFFKVSSIAAIIYKTRRVANIGPPSPKSVPSGSRTTKTSAKTIDVITPDPPQENTADNFDELDISC